jgi:hypothetical protein
VNAKSWPIYLSNVTDRSTIDKYDRGPTWVEASNLASDNAHITESQSIGQSIHRRNCIVDINGAINIMRATAPSTRKNASNMITFIWLNRNAYRPAENMPGLEECYIGIPLRRVESYSAKEPGENCRT